MKAKEKQLGQVHIIFSLSEVKLSQINYKLGTIYVDFLGVCM